MLMSPEGRTIRCAIHFSFKATNNDAEYEALIAGLKLAVKLKINHLKVFSDSQLVVAQMNGEFLARGEKTIQYLAYALSLSRMIDFFKLAHIPRYKNVYADALARLASSDGVDISGNIQFDVVEKPSIPRQELMEVTMGEKETWMTPIVKFLKNGELPSEPSEARRMRYKAARYTLYEEKLYRRGFNQPLLKCVDEEDGRFILKDVHEGVCGTHCTGQALAMKIVRLGYFWPTLKKDAYDYSKKCDICQKYSDIPHAPPEPLSVILSP